MFKKFVSTTVSSILIVGTLGGCSAKDCNPSHPKGGALFGGLGCAMFGGYAKRRLIMDKRVQISVEELQQSVKELQISEKNLQIAKDKNVEKL
ncbi:hypothetical protein GSY74_04595, partial [Sulfurovum sp. bin170]|uniref:hypothetical protein n=1 Tax=Sulfurovum sp. bin170 TaxID=2695268 RepID=UPI0013DF27F0